MSVDPILRQPRGNRPLVTVCIATYNQTKYIRDTVMSVLAQREPHFFDLEILVGDDHSTDDTAVILAELADLYGDALTIVTRTSNLGPTQNYLDLISRANGDFIAHLDGDDFWLPGKLLAQLQFMVEHPQCIAVYTGAVVIDTDGILIGGFSHPQPIEFGMEHLVLRGNFLNHSSMLYRRSGRAILLGVPAPFLDYRSHIELANAGMLGHINSVFVGYRAATENSMLKVVPVYVRDLYFDALSRGLRCLPKPVQTEALGHYFAFALADSLLKVRDKDLSKRVSILRRELDISFLPLLFWIVRRLCTGALQALVLNAGLLLNRSNTLSIVHKRK